MRFHQYLVSAFASVLLLVSCGGNNQGGGVKFNPGEKESPMSDSERAAAIAARKADLAVSPDSMFVFDGLKFSVLPPSITTDLTEAASEKMTRKIISIAGSNGVGGLAVNPVLGLASQVVCLERGLTGTAPQKAIVKYEITLYCGNFVTNEIYASTSFSVVGVGSTFESASLQAINEINDTPKIKEMFKTASEKALAWYDNPGNVTRVVDEAIAKENYALAMAILGSVPVQANKEVYDMALERNAEVCDMFFQNKADQLYSQMRGAIASSKGQYNPEVEAYLRLIPRNSKVFEEANALFKVYSDSIAAERRDNINRERALEDRKAADEKDLAMAELNNQQREKEMQFELEKIKAPYEAQATIEKIKADARVGVAQANAEGKKNANTGGFLGLGKLWDGGFKLINRVMDKLED